MAQEIGNKCAKYIEDQHEKAGLKKGQPRNEADMDYHNNHIGRQLGRGTRGPFGRLTASCGELCDQALKDGKLQTKP